MFSPSNTSTFTSNVYVFVSPAFNVTLFQEISLPLTLLPSVETFSKVVPSGTVSFTDVIASMLLLFVTVIVYEIIEPFLTISSLDVATLLASITGFTVSGVSLPSTTAAFLISPFSAVTTTVNDTATVSPAGTFTSIPLAKSASVNSLFKAPLIAILPSAKLVPSGIVSLTVTLFASTVSLVFVTVMLYVILLPVCTLLSSAFTELISAVLFNSNVGFTTSIFAETLSLKRFAFIQPTFRDSLTNICLPVSM